MSEENQEVQEEVQVDQEQQAPPSEDDRLQAAIQAASAGEEPASGKPSPEPEVKEPTPKEDKYSERLAELARRDRELQARQNRIKDAEAKIKEAEHLGTRLKDDPIGVLLDHGVDIVGLLEKAGQPQEEEKVDSKLAKELEELKAWKKSQEEQASKKERQSLYHAELQRIYEVVKGAEDDYEAILDRVEDGSLNDVFQALSAMYQKTGVLPTKEDYKEACNIVEEVYKEQEEQRLQRWAKSKRWAGKLNFGETDTKQASPAKASPEPPPKQKTLTNKLQREAPQRKGPMTDEERFAAAVEAAEKLNLKI